MRVIDPGHQYALDTLDNILDETSELIFVKREGPGYPGNVGHHPGTNIQEVLRALIDRVKYLDKQIPCTENKIIIKYLRASIIELEHRAARRHNRKLKLNLNDAAENLPHCKRCGHIGCDGIYCKGHT